MELKSSINYNNLFRNPEDTKLNLNKTMIKPPSRMVAPSTGLRKPSEISEKPVSKISMLKKPIMFEEDD